MAFFPVAEGCKYTTQIVYILSWRVSEKAQKKRRKGKSLGKKSCVFAERKKGKKNQEKCENKAISWIKWDVT